MINQSFYRNIIVRILILLLTFIVITPFINNSEKLFTSISILILIVMQIIFLIKYINKFNCDLANFFSNLKTNDVSYAFHDKSFNYLSPKFRNDIAYIREQLFNVRESIKIQQSYFRAVIENTQTGFISFDRTGKINIINKSALSLLNITQISNIETIEEIHPEFYRLILNKPDGTEKLINIKKADKNISLSVRISELKQKEDHYKIISFQNIQSELEQKEFESWHKLIRVLTHEINNSISPIISLADSTQKLLSDNNKTISTKEINNDTLEKTHEGLHIISQRGKGLINFINNYKNIASQKKIYPEYFKVAELFYNLELLLSNKLSAKNIKLSIDIKPFDLSLYADKKYMEQIFINLIQNAIDAIEHNNGLIELNATTNNTSTILTISDNGKGINKKINEQIFVPFFTTKQQGSGIGLSLTQQIISLHNGTIQLDTTRNNKTVFVIEIPRENL
ncbi:MAG: HAMP domain-containing histidine kinase [Bacteroidales bacterium]|nr:HAMP domain-containing histidine kinase [Bacteroidales bacterium]